LKTIKTRSLSAAWSLAIFESDREAALGAPTKSTGRTGYSQRTKINSYVSIVMENATKQAKQDIPQTIIIL
jgi:hypothetical protein